MEASDRYKHYSVEQLGEYIKLARGLIDDGPISDGLKSGLGSQVNVMSRALAEKLLYLKTETRVEEEEGVVYVIDVDGESGIGVSTTLEGAQKRFIEYIQNSKYYQSYDDLGADKFKWNEVDMTNAEAYEELLLGKWDLDLRWEAKIGRSSSVGIPGGWTTLGSIQKVRLY